MFINYVAKKGYVVRKKNIKAFKEAVKENEKNILNSTKYDFKNVKKLVNGVYEG